MAYLFGAANTDNIAVAGLALGRRWWRRRGDRMMPAPRAGLRRE
jgi:hypothetical protein